MAVLCVGCYAQAFSNCGALTSHCCGFSDGARTLGTHASAAVAPRLWSTELWRLDLAALRHMGSSQIRD